MRLKESELSESIQNTVNQLDTSGFKKKKEKRRKKGKKYEKQRENYVVDNSLKEESIKEEQVVQEEITNTEIEPQPQVILEEPKIETEIVNAQEDTSIQISEPLEEENKSEEPVTASSEEVETNAFVENSHTKMLNDLVKEVQIFADDEEFIVPKKAWKKILGIILALVIIASCVVLAIYFWPKPEDKSKDTPLDSNSENVDLGYSYTVEEDGIHFFNGKEEIDSYICVSEECSVYSFGRYQYHQDGVIALQDGNDVFLYDYVHKQEISENYTQLKNLMKDGNTKGFIAINSDGKEGIMDPQGKVVVPLIYDDLGYSIGGGDVSDYSYEHNVITASKDNSWGLISLDKGEELIPLSYDDIYYNDLDVFCGKQEGSWYVFDLDGKKVLEDGYDMVIPLSSYILVSRNGSFNILNYKGERVIQQDIPTHVIGFRDRDTSEIPTFKIETEGTVVTIYIMESSTDDTLYKTYKFNTVNGELTEVIR